MIELEFFLLRALFVLLNRLPRTLAAAVSRVIALLAQYVLRYRRGVIQKNLTLVFGDKTAKELAPLVTGFYRNFADLWMEFLQGLRLDSDYLARNIETKNLAVLENAVNQGNGVILATGHLGNFEWLGYALADKYPGKIAAVMKKIHNPRVNDFVVSMRKQCYSDLIYAHNSGKKMITVLRQGKMLLMAADQDARSSELFVDFLGQPSAVAPGIASLHLLTNAPVVFFAAIRTRYGRFTFHFETVKTDDLNEKSKEEATFIIMQRYNWILERWVRLYPEQWFWSHNRWKSKPNQEQKERLEQNLRESINSARENY